MNEELLKPVAGQASAHGLEPVSFPIAAKKRRGMILTTKKAKLGIITTAWTKAMWDMEGSLTGPTGSSQSRV